MYAESRSGFLRPDALHYRAAFVVLPLVSGGTIPLFGLVNLVWGSFYGLPGVAFHWLRIPHAPAVDLLFVLLWPLVASALLDRLGASVARLKCQTRIVALVAFAASFAAIVPIDSVMYAAADGSFQYEVLPLYVRLIAY